LVKTTSIRFFKGNWYRVKGSKLKRATNVIMEADQNVKHTKTKITRPVVTLADALET
jgi:hypothetical protein